MKLKWVVRLEITVAESKESGMSRLNDDDTETFYKHGYIWNLPRAIRYYKRRYGKIKYRAVIFPKLESFFTFFGKQNDYLFPSKGEDAEGYPFKKPHLWKTRFGFKTSNQLAKL